MRKGLIFFVLLINFTAISQERIAWQDKPILSWGDFRGTPKPESGAVASTGSGLSFKYSYVFENNKLQLDYTVTAHFYPLRSWYLKQEATPYILKHEQTHFDITELHARMFRKQLAETAFSKNPKDVLEKMYHEAEATRRKMQRLFDAQSDHSKNKLQEKEWEAFIEKKLKEYAQWQ